MNDIGIQSKESQEKGTRIPRSNKLKQGSNSIGPIVLKLECTRHNPNHDLKNTQEEFKANNQRNNNLEMPKRGHMSEFKTSK